MTSPPPAWPDTLPAPRDPARPYRVCLVCLGNICRSPMAEAVLRAALDRAGLGSAVAVDSAGTGDWHVGSRMDSRARAELASRGYDGTSHRARQVARSWLADRDLVLAMDGQNLADLRRMAGDDPAGDDPAGDDPAQRDRIRLLRSFDPRSGPDAEVPDPYYGESESFGTVLDLIEAAADGLAGALGEALAGDRRTRPSAGR
jgi:protein-tyrosine phosphatase